MNSPSRNGGETSAATPKSAAPGWYVVDCGAPDYLDGIQSQYTISCNGRPIAYAFKAGEAALLAAAPDLLEALGDLIAISAVMKPGSYGDAVLGAAVDAYDKALAGSGNISVAAQVAQPIREVLEPQGEA